VREPQMNTDGHRWLPRTAVDVSELRCGKTARSGKRKERKKATLTEKFAEIVVRIKPKWYVMENVDRTRKSIAYKNAREILSEAGYGITETVLDASKCGVPQRRRRFFSIGHLNNSNNFLVRQLKEKQRIKSLTPREYFDNKFPVDFFYRHPRNYNRRGIFSIDEPSPTIRGVNRPLPPGYKGHKNDPIEVSDQVRALTTEERAWIQTFPKNFKLLGTKTVNEQLIGNAVPVKLAEFVGKIILKYEETKCQNEVPALVN